MLDIHFSPMGCFRIHSFSTFLHISVLIYLVGPHFYVAESSATNSDSFKIVSKQNNFNGKSE